MSEGRISPASPSTMGFPVTGNSESPQSLSLTSPSKGGRGGGGGGQDDFNSSMVSIVNLEQSSNVSRGGGGATPSKKGVVVLQKKRSQAGGTDTRSAAYSQSGHSNLQVSQQNMTASMPGDTGSVSSFDSNGEDSVMGLGKSAQIKPVPFWKVMLKESVISIWLIVLLIAVIAVSFYVIDQVEVKSIEAQSALISTDIQHTLTTFVEAKLKVLKAAEYLYSTKQLLSEQQIDHPRYEEVDQSTLLPNPIELQLYEQAIAPFFADDSDLIGLYNGMSSLQTWKIHREDTTYLATQLRYAGNVTGFGEYFERYERRRFFNQSLNDFHLAAWSPNHTYLPTQQGWFQDAFAADINPDTGMYYGVWSGPEFQGTGIGAASTSYGLDPVMVYSLRVDWQQPGLYSCFKLKLLTRNVNTFLQELELPENGDVIIVNHLGLVAATRSNADLQVIPDAEDPTNAKLATVTHISTFPGFTDISDAELQSATLDAPILRSDGISIYSLDEAIEGWRVVVLLDGDVLIAPFTPFLNLMLAMCILLIILSFVSMAYSANNIRKSVKASSDKVFSKLLKDLLPADIATRCIEKTSWPIQDKFDDATVLFADMVGFTARSSNMTAYDLVTLLNTLIESFDVASLDHRVEKIKTIGDCYMAVTGVPVRSATHAIDMVRFGSEMLKLIKYYNEETDDEHHEPIEFRIGINSGPLVMGVMGSRRFAFDIFGDTVNVASRLESNGKPGMIRVSQSTYEKTHQQVFYSEPEDLALKGKEGLLSTYLVKGIKGDEKWM